MESFVGRQKELALLEEELGKVTADKGRFVWIRGRRRVGKSRLIEEFLRSTGVRHVFFQAPRREPEMARERFVAAVAESDLPAREMAIAGVSFPTWSELFNFASRETGDGNPVVIVIDELPYLVEKDDGFAADLQHAWDRYLKDRCVLLIGIGSDVRMMRTLTEYPAELHGRPTREIQVPPLRLHEVAEVTNASAVEVFDRYVVTGGFPQLVEEWRGETSLRQFLTRTLADSGTQFVTNGLRILTAELDPHSYASDVLRAIGSGERTNANIAKASGVHNEATLSTALKLLVGKGIVAEHLPFAAPPGRKNKRYMVADPYLRFWLRFVEPGLDEIDRDRSDLLIARIERDWPAYLGAAVEPLVRGAVERLLVQPDIGSRLGDARVVGSYWTRSNDVEVDLVGAAKAQPESISFVGSIKWRQRSGFNRHDLERLAAQREKVPGSGGAKLLAVSRRGFGHGTESIDLRLTAEDLLG